MSLVTGKGSRFTFRFQESEPPTPKNGTGETLALTPALSPRLIITHISLRMIHLFFVCNYLRLL